MGNLGQYIANILLEDFPLNEYSNKIINQLTDKFKQENPELDDDQIKEYIKRFDQIKNNLPANKRDILKYSWDDLEQTVAANQSKPKRIKAGKINDGEPEDANLVYNQNGLRIYIGKTKKACVKYGNGYSFCISARGGNNLYHDYRYERGGTPYFVFNDKKSSEQDERGQFIDPTHLLVVFVYENLDPYSDYKDDEETKYIRYNEPKIYYTVTTADNPPDGEEIYDSFSSIEYNYPELKGLEKIFKLVGVDPKEEAEYKLNTEYNKKIFNINQKYRNYSGFENVYRFDDIEWANERIDGFINGKLILYKFTLKLKPKPEISKNKSSNDSALARFLDDLDEANTNQQEISQTRLIKADQKIDEKYYKEDIIKNIIIPWYYGGEDGSTTPADIIDDWDMTYKKEDTPSFPEYEKYITEIKQLVDEYRKELTKTKLMKEGLEHKTKLTESQTATIGEFIKYACKDLGIQNPPRNLTFSYDTKAAKEKRSFGYFDPNSNKIWVYVRNRNMADILRTLAHELVHRKQDEDGRIDYKSGETGSDIENEANAQAGVLLRNYGKINNGIYEAKEFGNHLFGDKDSGVKIGWYKDELETDTPAEKELFNFLKNYADSEETTYSTINLDPYLNIFKTIKTQYPEIGDANLSPDTYIYRGTSISKEKVDDLLKDPNAEEYNQGTIIPNKEYSSRRKISSWSVSYFNAASFAMSTAERKGGVPVIMRAKASDADLFFNPKFMDKLSDQLEDETFNASNPIKVDIMIIKDYEDEFENIEAGYLHNK